MKTLVNEKEPPIGLIPKYIHDEKRFKEVCAAIIRYFNAGLKIPVEWIEEHNDFIEKLSNKITPGSISPRHPLR